jgi:eukaryotic-like serine/threonine-protein kinase
VLDFGKGKGLGHVGQPSGQSTDSGDLFGDPRYISPEVSRGDKLDQRSNIYSLGCILFEAATGSPMWTGNNWFAVIQRKMSESSPSIRSLRSDLPAALDLLIAKATDPQPEKRHQSIDEVARDFKAAGLPVANTALLTGSMS